MADKFIVYYLIVLVFWGGYVTKKIFSIRGNGTKTRSEHTGEKY